MKYRIELDRDTCIGTHSCCIEAKNFWFKADDGKIDLKNAQFNPETDKWELFIDLSDVDFQANKRAEELCPVEAIRIIPLDKLG